MQARGPPACPSRWGKRTGSFPRGGACAIFREDEEGGGREAAPPGARLSWRRASAPTQAGGRPAASYSSRGRRWCRPSHPGQGGWARLRRPKGRRRTEKGGPRRGGQGDWLDLGRGLRGPGLSRSLA